VKSLRLCFFVYKGGRVWAETAKKKSLQRGEGVGRNCKEEKLKRIKVETF
jgi:hypothetical protein